MKRTLSVKNKDGITLDELNHFCTDVNIAAGDPQLPVRLWVKTGFGTEPKIKELHAEIG